MLPKDPEELRYLHDIEKRDPAVAIAAIAAIDEIEVHLRYGVAGLKLVGWIIVALLALILWLIW